ncbi:MAG: hypothetical protein ACXVLM_03035 [Ilumatobacteraceae bacterium]
MARTELAEGELQVDGDRLVDIGPESVERLVGGNSGLVEATEVGELGLQVLVQLRKLVPVPDPRHLLQRRSGPRHGFLEMTRLGGERLWDWEGRSKQPVQGTVVQLPSPIRR